MFFLPQKAWALPIRFKEGPVATYIVYMKSWGKSISWKLFILVCAAWLGAFPSYAITTTAVATASTCYNDGTLTLTSTGGSAPYTYTITAGPALPGISYPYALPAGQSTFSNLAAGSYSGTVRDASGATGTFTGTVGGTYTFPTMLIDTPVSPGDPYPMLHCRVSGGRAPYEYAISSTGPVSGYSPYQTSDSFYHICPGTYWLRVRDACGNIFTDSRHYSYSMIPGISCMNFAQGIVHAEVSGGHAPFTYTLFNRSTSQTYTNTTGDFSGIGAFTTVFVTVRDSCGVTDTIAQGQRVQRFRTNCNNDGIIYSHIDDGDTLTMTCTSCVPVQTVTQTGSANPAQYDTIFRNVPPGTTPQIVVIASSRGCGQDTLIPVFIAPVVPFMQISTPGCNTALAQVYTVSGTIVPVDSFVAIGPGGVLHLRNSSGLFSHLPDGSYTITAYLPASACVSVLSNSVILPAMNLGCYQQMKDSTCQNQWQLSVNPIAPERYSILLPSGDTVAEASVSTYSDRFFYGLLPSHTYVLISDSGCALPITTPAIQPAISSASYVTSCASGPIMDYEYVSGNFCATKTELRVWHNGSMVIDTSFLNTHVRFHVPDSGLYIYQAYIRPTVYPHQLRYDSICHIDSGSLYIIDDSRPYLSPAFINVCDSNTTDADSLYFHIAGGFAPYTVEIPGYDTLVLSGTTGRFPAHHPGSYPMIVYDNCGVSRSLAIRVIDTCGCPIATMILSDTLVCVGDTIVMQDISLNGVTNEWQIDGQSYSGMVQTIYVPDSGTHQILLISGAVSGCIDSAISYIMALPASDIDLGSDTTYCDTFTRVLNSGIAGTIWSTGDTAPQITVHGTGLYIAAASGGCGVQRDSILISSHAISGLSIYADSTSLCSNITDSLLLTAAIDSPARSPVNIRWSTGQQATGVYTAAIWAYTSGSYQVTAQDGQCSAAASMTIVPIICDTVCHPCDTPHCNPCDTPCIGCPDTACISRLALPNVFSPNGDGRNDSFYIPHLCTYYSVTIRVYDRWGLLVFESHDINKAWDGTYRGKPQPADVYSCFICSQARPADPVVCREWAMTLMR